MKNCFVILDGLKNPMAHPRAIRLLADSMWVRHPRST